MNNISGTFWTLGIISFLLPLIITSGYLVVRNKRITQKLFFLVAGAACCFGVRFFASFIISLVLSFFIDPQKPPTSSNSFTFLSITANLLIEIAVYWVVLAYLEKKLSRDKVEQREDGGNFMIRDTVIFSIGILFGFGIWFASSAIFGKKEAFDSPYYFISLLVGGVLCSLIGRERAWRWVIAILIGQLVGFAILVIKDAHRDGLWPLGMFFIVLYSSVTFVGSLLGASLNSNLKRN